MLVVGIKLCTSHGHTPCVYLGERCLYSHVCKDYSQGEEPDHNDSRSLLSAYVVHAGHFIVYKIVLKFDWGEWTKKKYTKLILH